MHKYLQLNRRKSPPSRDEEKQDDKEGERIEPEQMWRMTVISITVGLIVQPKSLDYNRFSLLISKKKSTRISVRRPSYTKAKEIQFNDEQSVNILSAHFNLLIAINAVTAAAAAMVLFSWDSFIVYYLYAI